MTSSAVEITNLLYRYAELMDAGDFEGCAELFADASIVLDSSPGASPVNAEEMLSIWHSSVVIYDDGTPRTRHQITNPILAIDEEAGTASVSYTHLTLPTKA